ncbi:MAG: hypothetical protein UU71_C0039G0005 [Parcubacteria group bacterium GW2011_GWB1_41_6]|uniref:Glycosidase n=1 Tax=Candidatus Nomurabacteria bacterium RIFCSPLOWO2_02_FULL_40_67 TaxID=1801787 RepID=A0A1F6Y3R0_9BACT|nr:MAG: hypothetical protein UU01_C0001G0050 [Parcubacteria group bacterium GW2011_GWA2_40_37]KKS13922.1 MAG: hypothetical protein UU71_C0039G0005 [Parcubacteria group bacterium GW2011_GWB1_41_6]KKS70667.1 MAG: hypothetical protein UV43_C0056G0007 [Parcubacteria group bacterium GW2011_GWF2_42_7]OGI61897.1 MAG: hypothetical protein A2W12_00415 [Candidatus Nomurabacteria bacterium RBG_16_40_11]OGI72856.1 MAG: hypothetical protein A2W56_01995 [Candidatus Nomurabacteria bacterium RIFCSPHIGHO2_02_41
MKTNMAALKKKKKIIKRKIPKTVKRKTVVKKIAVKKKKTSVLNLKRSNKNPIITPTSGRSWESKASFNPTAIFHDGKVHIIYRAIGDSDNSVLGYAQSTDGVSFDQNFKELAYSHANAQSFSKTEPQINYLSGGGWGGGCEDPRLTLLGDQVYMIYTAFDGWGSVRMALTSISLDDFISKRFNWKKPVLISPPSEIHKNWALFPEKIRKGGKEKYAILHAISPKIMIDYFDSLNELDGNKYIYSVHQGSRLWESRDKLTRGIGPSPIKTKYGWLVLYHKMEKHETHRYKLWAMLLDSKDPTKILHDSEQPILEPDEWYENEGYKGGVVYSCGAIVKNGELFVYYGGADKVSCVATADLDKFLKELVHKSGSKLKTKKII